MRLRKSSEAAPPPSVLLLLALLLRNGSERRKSTRACVDHECMPRTAGTSAGTVWPDSSRTLPAGVAAGTDTSCAVPPLLLLKRFAQALVGDRRKEAAREDGIDRSGVEVERPDEGFGLVRSGAQEIDELVREIEPLLGCPGDRSARPARTSSRRASEAKSKPIVPSA